MATDYFLKLEGIDGESEQKDHANEIELLSWSWGETNSGSAAGGGGQGSGKVDMQDFSFAMSLIAWFPPFRPVARPGRRFRPIPSRLISQKSSIRIHRRRRTELWEPPCRSVTISRRAPLPEKANGPATLFHRFTGCLAKHFVRHHFLTS